VIQAIGRLHLVINIPGPVDTSMMQSDWTRFLPDPAMLNASLHFARHFYAARLQRHAAGLMVDAYRGSAIRSVREHLNAGISDNVIAAILILSVLDVSRAMKSSTLVDLPGPPSLTLWSQTANSWQY
jgi:hypothetical protein